MSASPASFALPSKLVSHARHRGWSIGGSFVSSALKAGWSFLDFFAGAYGSGSPAKVTPLMSTVSRLRQNAPWSIMIELNMLAAPNAVSCVPLTPSPESMSSAAGIWLGAKPCK